MPFLSFFKRARGARPNGSKSVKDFLKMAEVQRHAHFAEGCDELDWRTDGHEPSMDLDRHVAFAQIAKQRTADFEKSGKRRDLLVSELCFTWCACFVPEDTLEELNDAVRLSNDANHGAHFAMAMSRARDQLGEQYFKPIQHDEAAIGRRAKMLLRKRWAQEATIFESYSDTCTADDLIQWIGAGCSVATFWD